MQLWRRFYHNTEEILQQKKLELDFSDSAEDHLVVPIYVIIQKWQIKMFE